MKKGLIAAALMGLLGAFGVGCGNVCDDAGDICSADAEPVEDGAEDGETVEVECTGAAECQAQCVVDADSCDFTDADLAKCFGACEE